MRRLGRRWIESPERDVIGAGLTRLHREMAAVVAGLADLRRRPEQGARLPNVAVGLAEVHAVGAEPFGQRHAVVDDERDLGLGANALQRLGETRELMLGTSLTRSWKAEATPGSSAAFKRSGNAPPTSCGLIR